VWKVLRPGGRFVFTVETGDSGEDLSAKGFRLLKGGRFGYSRKYMDDMAASQGTPYVTQM
jgi:predicted TPR repeat methyltransferase